MLRVFLEHLSQSLFADSSVLTVVCCLQLHQAVMAKEELQFLTERSADTSACLLAFRAESDQQPDASDCDDSSSEMNAVGTLDLVLQSTLAGEVLRGELCRPCQTTWCWLVAQQAEHMC